jgi:hypothetical protein
VFVQFDLEGMELVCDNGETITPRANQPTEFVPSGGAQLIASLDFSVPDRSATKIIRWEGSVGVTIPGKSVSIEFGELVEASKKTLTAGDLNVTLEKARKNRDVYEILVGITLAGTQSADSFQGWAALNEAYILDAKGAKIEHAGWSTTRMMNTGIGLSYIFELENGFDGCTFVYRAPRSIVHQTVEYALEDVPLP